MSTQLRGQIYTAAYITGFVLMLLITVLRRKAYKTSLIRAVAYSFITFFSGLCGALIGGLLYDLLAYLKGIAAFVRVDVLGAVVFTSLFLLAAVGIEKKLVQRRLALIAGTAEENTSPPRHVSFRDTMDLVIPGAFIVFACIKFGCAFRGCCFGVEWSWGVTAQYYYSKTVFPVQAFESASIFVVAVASHFIQKTSFYRRGMSGPFAAFLYGMARFFWEFFRYNPPELRHFFLGLTIWQLFCILIFIVAGTWIAILFRTQPAEPLPKKRRVKKIKKTVKNSNAKKHDTKRKSGAKNRPGKKKHGGKGR